MKRLVIVGGGISGLAAAWAARRRADEERVDLDIVVLERDSQVGGKARSVLEDGWLVETGPLGYLDNEPTMTRLIEEAGLGDEVVVASGSAAKRFVCRDGRMREIPLNPLRLFGSGVLRPTGVLRLFAEPIIPARKDESDESVWDFAARRFGRQAADRLAHPMMLGVFAGDARRLSLRSAFPMIAELEAKHGSLVKGMIARQRERRLNGQTSRTRTRLTSLQRGLQSLPVTLAERGRYTVRENAHVESIAPDGSGGWRVAVLGGRESIPCDALILAGEAWAMARCVSSHAPELANELTAIHYPPVAVVALGYGERGLASVSPGFGVLVPRNEGIRTLGITWDTHIFPGRSARGQLLVRAMLGGTCDEAISELDDDALLTLAEEETARLLRIDERPIFRSVSMWPRAIPQYELGHAARVARIEEHLARTPSLLLAGNSLHGSSFVKSGARGIECGERAVGWLAGKAREALASSLP